MGSYALTRTAADDIAEIEDYTARQWGDEQADRYINALFDAFQALAANPDIGRRRADVPPPYRVLGVGSHLIIYRTIDSRVEVLNILHPAMDLATRLRRALARQAGRDTDPPA